MFDSISNKLSQNLKLIRSKGRLSKNDTEHISAEIKRTLLDADVALPVANDFAYSIKQLASSSEIKKSINPAKVIIDEIEKELIRVLGQEKRDIRKSLTSGEPTIIMLAGLQGSGKTSFSGKLAKFFKNNGDSVLLVAADLQRPGAVEQLQIVANTAGVACFAPYEGSGKGNPVKAAKKAVQYAKKENYSVVIIDTAGRLGVDSEMMKQAAEIKKVVNPQETLFVIDSLIGQDAVQTANAFQKGVDFTGVVLTKLDADSKGGAALSVATVTGKPILFASTGEKVDDLEEFYPERMASRILDKGDLETLMEKANAVMDQGVMEQAQEKFSTGEDFDLNDFMEQMNQVKKMGSMEKIIQMLPGAKQYSEALKNFDSSQLDRMEVLVKSMTPFERANPKQINGSRRTRIAKGAGSTVNKLNDFLKRFEQAQKMMKTMVPQKENTNFQGASGVKAKAKFKKLKKGKSGNPAKRALEQKLFLEKQQAKQ